MVPQVVQVVPHVDPRCPRWCTAKNLTPLTHLVTGSLACPNPITPLCKLHHLANSGIYKSANTKKNSESWDNLVVKGGSKNDQKLK